MVLAAAEWSVWVQGGPARFEALLSQCLRSSDPRERIWSVRSSSRIRPPRCARLLGDCLESEEDSEVRREIVWALGQLEDAAVLPLLREAARDTDPGVRAPAARAFASFGEEGAREVVRLLEDPSADVRFAATLSLSQLDSAVREVHLPRLLERERNEQVRWALVRAITVRPDLAAEHSGLLARVVLDRNHLAGMYALGVLPELDGTEGASEAIELAGDGDRWWLSRLAALRAVGRWLSRGNLPAGLREAAVRLTRRSPVSPEPRTFPDVLLPLQPEVSDPGEGVVRRLPVLVVDVVSKGRMVLDLYLEEAPHHASALIELARRGLYRAVLPVRADPLQGLELAPRGSPDLPGSLPPEPHRAPIRRGTVIEVSGRSGAGRFLIAALPMPELEGRVTVIGRVLVNSRLLDHITGGDTLTISVE